MKKLLLFFVLVLFAATYSAGQKPAIIPMPAEYHLSGGYFEMPQKLRVMAEAEHNDMIGQSMERASELGVELDYKISSKKNKPAHLTLNLNPLAGNGNADAYHLAVTPENIRIEASSEAGLFYGLQTLLQLFVGDKGDDKSHKIPCLTITDAPAQAWRGIMLDESRHFFGTQTVKQMLDWMAFYKLNKFHWHLTDTPGWRIEIKKYPKLTSTGGIGNESDPQAPAAFYTQKEIKEIVRYAQERFIEVIPEIDMPGHAAAANRAYPEFSGGGSKKYPEFTFNPGKEGTYAYLTDILREVGELFPSKYIHIGGDEVHFGNHHWKKLPEIKSLMKEHNLKDLQQVEYYFLNRMADSIKALNKTMIGWDEIVNAKVPAELSMVMWWRHDKPEELQKALDMGYKTVLCPRIPLYFDFVQHNSHTSGRRWAGDFVTLEKTQNFNVSYASYLDNYPGQILGIQANLWSETFDTKERLLYMTFPRIAALSEAAWAKQTGSYLDFLKRLEPSLKLYQKMDIPFFNPANPDSTPEIKAQSSNNDPESVE